MADTDTTAAPAPEAPATETPAPAPAPKPSKAAAPAPAAETAPAAEPAPEAPAETWYPLSAPLSAGAYYDNLTGRHYGLKGGEVRQVSFSEGVDLTGVTTAEQALALIGTLPRGKYTIRYEAPAA